LTPDQTVELRSIIGIEEPPNDADLEFAYDRLQSIPAVALEVQRGRLADLRSRPSSLTIDGDRTESWTETIRSLERQVAELDSSVAQERRPSTGMVSVSRFQRAGRVR
jgi:hypothetical protein